MVEKLRSIWKNQLSSLALKLLAVFIALVWYRNTADMTSALVFGSLYWLWYFRPTINNKKFVVSAAINFMLALFAPTFSDPRLNALMILTLVAIYGILIGVKNLIFLHRDLMYYFGQFLLTAIFSLFIFLGGLDIANEIVIGIGLALLSLEFYMFFSPSEGYRVTLSALISAFLALQLGWVISIVPTSIWAKAGLFTLLVFTIVEITAHYLRGELAAKRLKRDLSIAFLGIIALFLL